MKIEENDREQNKTFQNHGKTLKNYEKNNEKKKKGLKKKNIIF